jgi:DNA-binding transcriptional MerR regulator
MTQKLITIDQLIERAKNRGVNFGKGSPKIHLSYLSSLGIIPPAQKRKVGNQITGCYEEQTLNTIEKIESWKEAGLTYSQIKVRLETEALSNDKPLENLKNYVAVSAGSYIRSTSAHNLVFLLIGLFLGYLLAFTGVNHQNQLNADKLSSRSNNLMSNTSTSPVDESTSQVLTIVNTERGKNANAEPIYLIAVPKQNLEKLGKTTILNLLNN